MAGQTEDTDAIRQLAEEWHAGWLAGDAGALLALYTDDPVLMPQNQPAVIGREAIRSPYQSVFDEFAVNGGGELLEVEVAGD
ncbi:MAG: SgcJ/EcaC family oxidoreductase [Candidatus Latescibacteria bacterium]|nr:SgcJ/EcaC family oxidoreductase [Candidatus Latescibacterota bacterium]NIT00778.1 SgcJ/EcaC family oxidoreductase [Candidatus Latescibacterota bacterium]